MDPVILYDTTLRDGAQGEDVTFTAEEKLRVARRLDDFGIHYIEGGFPLSNKKDVRFFELAKGVDFKFAQLAAFGSTRKAGKAVENDEGLNALIAAETPAVTIFGKTWDLHVKKIIHATLKENLAMIHESVAFLKSYDKEVIYDAEHFFDGFKDNPQYAVKTLVTALDAGAEFLVLCDTNGGSLPCEIESIFLKVKDAVEKERKRAGAPVKFGIHTHNDCGLAVGNSIAALHHGAVMVQGTINGYGERCGNADLTSIIPLLKLKMDCDCISDENLSKLRKLSRFVSESANMIPLNSRPFVGRSAFAHKGGVHVNAIMKTPKAYEHMDPELVGNSRRVLVSDLAGKSNVEYKAKELGIKLEGNGVDSRKIVEEIKRLESEGYQFDVADGSLKILMEKLSDQFNPVFDLESFRVYIEKEKDSPCQAHATVKISVDGRHEITAAEGQGPVSALDNALRKALENFFPGLDHMRLVDFKVRVMDGRHGTGAKVRVFIASRDEEQIWSTIGVSQDIIEASWQALADSFRYKLGMVTPDNK
jgi:2-isopropylmalate synthase